MERNFKILLLEDDPSDAELIQKYLQRADFKFRPRVATDRNEFVKAISEESFDIILSDHSLPQFTSIEALKICKEKNLRVPFILVTGTVSEEFAVNIIKEGADDYILKTNLKRLPSSILKAFENRKIQNEKELAEKQLHEKSNFLSLLMESLPTIFYSLDINHSGEVRTTHISDNVTKITGYEPSQFIESKDFWISHIHHDDLRSALVGVNGIFQTGAADVEYRWQIADGSFKWIQDKQRLVTKDDGSRIILGMWIDVSEKKKSEENLSKSEERGEALIKAIPDLLFVVSNEGVFLDYKADDENDLFAPPYKFLGRKISEVMPVDLASQLMEKVESVYKSRTIDSLEYTIGTTGNKEFFEARLAPFHDDKILVIVRDITEERRAGQYIDHERQFRDVVLHNIKVGILATDPHGKITVINEASQKMFGVSASITDLKETLNRFEVYTADGKTKLELNDLPLSRALRREMVTNFELNLINRFDGTHMHLVSNAQPIYDQARKMVGAVVAYHDITNLKITEDKLKAKIFELDTFIYRTAHDLRGPLTSILGLVAVAKKDSTDDEKTLMILEKFDKTAIKLDNVLNDLVSVSKITRGKANFTKIHLDTLIPALLKRLDNKSGRNHVKFNLDIPNRHQFLSDRYLIRSVLQNILENSLQYRSKEVEDAVIDISVRDVNDYVRIQVADNGQGIPDDIQEKIFDMFYKGNYASTGTGLGLYIARVAVEKLGGSISVSSNYGQGTTVSIYLPALNDMQIENLLTKKVL